MALDAAPGLGPGVTAGRSGSPHDPTPTQGGVLPFRGGRARLGTYHLVAPLARGCQAEVWKAVRVEPIVEMVALKLLAPGREPDPVRLARFHREARRGARLDHPALLPTYEFGNEHGSAYMVMPLVDGFTLGDVLDQRCRCRAGAAPLVAHRLAFLPEPEYLPAVVRILAKIARGVQAAHAARVVHRDIKPANILLDRHHEDRAFLIDFGLGRDLEDATLDQLRTCEGTLHYMAPEKLLGRQVDEVRCDLFALGVTLFEAVTLSKPRAVPATLPRSSWAEYLAGTDLPRPRAVHPALPADLDAIVSRTLARDPARRYPSATALAADLDRFLAGVPVTANRRQPASLQRPSGPLTAIGPPRPSARGGLPAALCTTATVTESDR